MSEHTPLPWAAVANGHVLGKRNGPPSFDVLSDNPPDLVCDRVTEANGRFIAHACNCHDELLAALKGVLEGMPFGANWDSQGKHPSWLLRARAAILKAEDSP